MSTRKVSYINQTKNIMGAVQAAPRVLFKNISASTKIWGGAGTYWGFYVNSTSSGVIKVWDSLTNSGTLVQNSVTPAIGSYVFNFGVELNTGLYIELVSGSIDITVFYRPRQ